MDLLEPKLIHLEKSGDFYISRLPCMVAREVFLRYAASNVNVIELARNYAPSSGDIATKMLSYTAHFVDGREIRMENDTLLNQHVLSFEDLGKLEGEMIMYNFSFLDVARWSPYLARYKTKLESLSIKILTHLLESSLKGKPQHFTS